MALNAKIVSGRGQTYEAAVSSRGELITAPFAYSEAYAVAADVNNQAFNFVGPIAGKRFVITAILLYANRLVGINDASVQIYEASADDSTTEDKVIMDIEMPQQQARDITGLNLIVTEGKWVNIKTDDNTTFATLMGYYIDA